MKPISDKFGVKIIANEFIEHNTAVVMQTDQEKFGKFNRKYGRQCNDFGRF